MIRSRTRAHLCAFTGDGESCGEIEFTYAFVWVRGVYTYLSVAEHFDILVPGMSTYMHTSGQCRCVSVCARAIFYAIYFNFSRSFFHFRIIREMKRWCHIYWRRWRTKVAFSMRHLVQTNRKKRNDANRVTFTFTSTADERWTCREMNSNWWMTENIFSVDFSFVPRLIWVFFSSVRSFVFWMAHSWTKLLIAWIMITSHSRIAYGHQIRSIHLIACNWLTETESFLNEVHTAHPCVLFFSEESSHMWVSDTSV